MPIQFVGRASASQQGQTTGTMTVSLTALTGGIDTAARTDDLVVVVWGIGAATDRNMVITTTGYTVIAELYANDTSDANLEVAYKRMGTTADTSVVFPNSGNADNGNAALAYVFRGVDATTPLDVTSTTATAINSGRPDGPAITPTTAGTVIMVAGAGANSSMTAFTQPGTELSNFFSLLRTEQHDISVGAGTFAWTSGTFDPVQWTGGSTATSASWAAVTLAMREAVTGGPTQNLTGTLFTNTSTFGAGTVTQSTPLTGTLYVDPDAFGAGAVTAGAVTLTGTLYADPDSFGAGAVTTVGGLQDLAGTLYVDPDAFGSGAVASVATVAGTLYVDPDSFGTATVSLSVTGTLYVDPDAFGAGAVTAGAITLTGTRYVDPDAFGAGAVTAGAVTLTGTLYADPDSFGAGAVTTGGALVEGLVYVDPDTFGAGAVGATYSVTGTNYVDPDSFGSGVVSLLFNVVIDGTLYANDNVFYGGVVTNVGGGPAINPRDIAMRRLQPWKKKYKV